MDTSEQDMSEVEQDVHDEVVDALSHLGTGYVFRQLDATDTSPGKVELSDGTVANPQRFGFDVQIDDGEAVALEWHIEKLLRTLAGEMADAIGNADIDEHYSFSTAFSNVVREGTHLVLPGVSDGYLGDVPLPTSLCVDKYTIADHTALVVDRDRFGYCVHGEPITVDSYHDTDNDVDIACVRLRRDYVVMNDDAAKRVDTS